jgi:hypothetical protein
MKRLFSRNEGGWRAGYRWEGGRVGDLFYSRRVSFRFTGVGLFTLYREAREREGAGAGVLDLERSYLGENSGATVRSRD